MNAEIEEAVANVSGSLSSMLNAKREDALADHLPSAGTALAKGDITQVRAELDEAKGDITQVRAELDELLEAFQINLDRTSLSYRQLGMAVLNAHVKALKDIERRNAGEPVDTPAFTRGPLSAPEAGGTLRNAVEGWEKERVRATGTVHEYKRAVEMFIQLYGDMPVVEIRKSHARDFRHALQSVPKTRRGALLRAPLPELND
jgi:hypothetical protein